MCYSNVSSNCKYWHIALGPTIVKQNHSSQCPCFQSPMALESWQVMGQLQVMLAACPGIDCIQPHLSVQNSIPCIHEGSKRNQATTYPLLICMLPNAGVLALLGRFDAALFGLSTFASRSLGRVISAVLAPLVPDPKPELWP